MRMIHSIIIPRVSKTEMTKTKLSKLAPVEFHYYNGPKKHTSPYTEDHQGIPFQDVVKVNKDIKAALQLDVQLSKTLKMIVNYQLTGWDI